MKVRRCGARLGLAVLAVVACAAAAIGTEPAEEVIGTVTDEEGSPLEGVTVQVCGVEQKLADGSWRRNHRCELMMPKCSMDQAGRFIVPFDGNDVRVNLRFEKEGFAPTFVDGISPQAQDLKVVMQRGTLVSGTVSRLIRGQLEPVKGTAVELRSLTGDLASQRRAFRDPLRYVWEEGGDLPYRQRVFTDHEGRYTVALSPPSGERSWFLVCLDEAVALDLEAGQPTVGPNFVVVVQVREAASSP